jgi:hypothetical protein
MAFQIGTQIRPELARADVSGFARAGMITGQALANLGQDIGEGIEKYQRNKQITASSLAQLEALGSANPAAYGALKAIGGDVSKSISNIEKGDYKQKDVLSALGAMTTYMEATKPPKLSAFQEKVQALEEAGFSKQESTMMAARGQTIKVGGGDDFSPQSIVEQTYIQPIVEGFGRSQELGRKAQVGLELLEQGVETGFGQEFLMQAKKGLTAAGFGDFDISNQELFKQQIEPMMMDFIQNTKGAISEREMDLFGSWTAGLGKSVEGNRKILKAMEKAAENSKVTNQMVRRYYQEKGAGADPFVIQQQAEDYLNANSIIDYADSAVQPSPATPTGKPDPESEADKILKARGL